MPVKCAAGTLLYRRSKKKGLQVLIVHASGNYNRRKPWSIPKGMLDPGEDAEQAARRETEEETGLVAAELRSLGVVVYQKSGKEVHAFAGPAPDEEPRAASWEIDQARFVPLDEARKLLHPDQAQFIDRLEALLAGDEQA